MAPAQQLDDEGFVRAISACQRGLFAYIVRLVPRTADALDILQETNLLLWRKREEFQTGTDFNAWAATVAYFTVLSYRKRGARGKLQFDDALVEQLAQEAAPIVGQADGLLAALSQCLEKLPQKDRALLALRYERDLKARGIAAKVNRSARAVSQALYRIRAQLMECIERNMPREEAT